MTPITLLVLDVDGVLTAGHVVPGPDGDRSKSFNVRDGHALKLWRQRGGQVAILSARISEAVTHRAVELGIRHVRQGIADKLSAFQQLLTETDTAAEASAYIGDDVPDVPVMRRCGLAIAVGDAAAEAKRAAHFVTRRFGGHGGVAEAVEWLLRKQGCYPAANCFTAADSAGNILPA